MARLEIARLDNDPNAPENGRIRFDVDTRSLTMDDDTASLDSCGCCEGLRSRAPVSNDPGLPALRYRVDTQPGFYARMLQSLPLARGRSGRAGLAAPAGRAAHAQQRRSDGRAASMRAACVADVLTFYQERIANEGFLRTATERRSVLELARAIGYELKPGVAASVLPRVHGRGRARRARRLHARRGHAGAERAAAGQAAAGLRDQRELVARAEWNALVPRQLRPADMAIIDVTQRRRHAAQGAGAARPERQLPAGHRRAAHGPDQREPVPARPGPARADATVDAIEVGRVYFTDATTGIAGGDLLLFVGKRGNELVEAGAARA